MTRLLPLLLITCFTLPAFAQDDQQSLNPSPRSLAPSHPLLQGSILPSDSGIVGRNLQTFWPKKPGVYALPQDNMPCIVPDSTKSVKIHNAWKGSLQVPFKGGPPRIPNLSTRPNFLKHRKESDAAR